MSEQYTSGPWAADIHGHIMAHGGTTTVASTWTTPDGNYPEGRPYRANAHLIASSPDLLAACEAAEQCILDFIDVYKRDCSKLVFDEAVKSLRDDALCMIKAALSKTRSAA